MKKILALLIGGLLFSALSVTSALAADCDFSGGSITGGCTVPSGGLTVPTGLSVSGSNAIENNTTGNSITNNGTLTGTSHGFNNNDNATILNFVNNGTITASSDTGLGNGINSTITSLTNNAGGDIHGAQNGIWTNGLITNLTNAGSIIGDTGNGVMIFSCCGFINGSINTLNNEVGGTIHGGSYGIAVNTALSTLTNSGIISGNTFDIWNNSTISNLNNVQGASSSALTYSGALPTNYNIIINSSSNFGQLAVSNGSGTMNFGIFTGSTVAPGTYSTVLSGISSGNLVTTSGSYNGLSWQLVAQSGSPTIWDLLFNPAPGASQPSFTTNAGTIASSTADVLDGLSSTATDPGMMAAITSLQNMNASEQSNALRRIAPETNRSTEVASRQTLSSGLDTVSARIESVRGQGYVASLQDDLKQGKVKVASNGEMSGLLSADAAKNHSFWMKGFGAHGNQDQKSGFAGYNSKTWGTAFGADTLLENNWLVGAAFTYARTDVDMTNFRDGDNSDIKTYQATAYTSHDFGKWYLDGMLSYAEQRFNSRRDTVITGIAKGNFDGHQVATRITAGMPFSLSAVTTLTPTIGLEWNRLKQDSYTETGAGALSMNVQGETANRVRSVIGARLATEMLSNGITIKPSLRASWRHDFNNDGIDSTSTFTGGGASFKTPGQDLASNSYNVGATLAFQRSGNFIFSAHVDGEKASGYNAVSGQIMGQWLF